MARIWITLALVVAISTGASATAAAQAPDPAARSREASRAMNDGRFDAAAEIYRGLVETLPRDAGLWMNLGMALAMGGHEAEALEPLQRALALQPGLLPAQLFLGSSYLALGQPDKAVAPLERVVAAQPSEIEHRRVLAQAYSASGRVVDAVTQLRKVTELAPKFPGGWYALGHAYNALTQDAMATFGERAGDEPWRQLLLADALLADGRFTDAFTVYRSTLEQLPSMVSIHESIARLYDQTGHADWAKIERARAALTPAACAKRKALCEFRAGRHRAALVATLGRTDPEARYWRARAATELALASFKQLDRLPDSRERREVRATLARAERRYTEAIADLKVALTLAPGDPALVDDLGTAYYLAREYDQAIATLKPLLASSEGDARLLTVYGDSLLQLQRVEEAVQVLRRAVAADASDCMARQALGRAYAQAGDFAAAIPLLEAQLAEDMDGSLHVQLARAYSGMGQKEKSDALLERSQVLQRAEQERNAAAGQRAITPPK